MKTLLILTLGCIFLVAAIEAFIPSHRGGQISKAWLLKAEESNGAHDPNEIVARRIIVRGDVQGGYYRSCVLNEVRVFCPK